MDIESNLMLRGKESFSDISKCHICLLTKQVKVLLAPRHWRQNPSVIGHHVDICRDCLIELAEDLPK
jgi:hypothetical protein